VNETSYLHDTESARSCIAAGGVVATSVFAFDVSIQAIHDIPDVLASKGIGGGRMTGLVLFPSSQFSVPFRCVMPIGAGVIVAWLASQVCRTSHA